MTNGGRNDHANSKRAISNTLGKQLKHVRESFNCTKDFGGMDKGVPLIDCRHMYIQEEGRGTRIYDLGAIVCKGREHSVYVDRVSGNQGRC
jgi:hypothetical protein